MTSPDLDRTLAGWLESRAPARAPEHLLGATLHRTARTRPRSAVRIPERWLSMATTVLRPATLPRGFLVILATLALIVALAATALLIGGRPSSLPAVVPVPPSGPAANGLLAFEHAGDIYSVEPDGSDRRLLVGGPGPQGEPAWSPDGTRLAYLSAETQVGPWDLVVADADGSDPATVASGIIETIGWGPPAWSPDGSAPDGAIAWFGEGDPCCLTLREPGGEPRHLPGVAPVWSPDGLLIATEVPEAEGFVAIVDRAGEIVATIEQANWPPSWQRRGPLEASIPPSAVQVPTLGLDVPAGADSGRIETPLGPARWVHLVGDATTLPPAWASAGEDGEFILRETRTDPELDRVETLEWTSPDGMRWTATSSADPGGSGWITPGDELGTSWRMSWQPSRLQRSIDGGE